MVWPMSVGFNKWAGNQLDTQSICTNKT